MSILKHVWKIEVYTQETVTKEFDGEIWSRTQESKITEIEFCTQWPSSASSVLAEFHNQVFAFLAKICPNVEPENFFLRVEYVGTYELKGTI